MKSAIAAFVALAGLALACLGAAFPPTSECSTPNQVNPVAALVLLAVYAAAGLFAARRGGTTERTILIAGTSLIIAGHFAVLSITFDIAVEMEAGCREERAAVERRRAAP